MDGYTAGQMVFAVVASSLLIGVAVATAFGRRGSADGYVPDYPGILPQTPPANTRPPWAGLHALKCVKCGSHHVHTNYRRAASGQDAHLYSQRTSGFHTRTDEHLDRRCKNCSFEWETDCKDRARAGADAIDAGDKANSGNAAE
jgi:hypothetical protein